MTYRSRGKHRRWMREWAESVWTRQPSWLTPDIKWWYRPLPPQIPTSVGIRLKLVTAVHGPHLCRRSRHEETSWSRSVATWLTALLRRRYPVTVSWDIRTVALHTKSTVQSCQTARRVYVPVSAAGCYAVRCGATMEIEAGVRLAGKNQYEPATDAVGRRVVNIALQLIHDATQLT